MNYDEILTFLAILDGGSIAKAAQTLFISQGTASTRIQQLERQLGFELFYRQKGVRHIVLSPQGREFLPLARQLYKLNQDAMQLKRNSEITELNITALDLINSLVFSGVYKEFIKKHPDILLTIGTQHSRKTYPLIEQRVSDIGFVSGKYNFPSVHITPLYSEKMVFLYHQQHPFAVSQNAQDLAVENEIYLDWSREFRLWHNQYFDFTRHKKVTLGTVVMLPNFIGEPELWSIVTEGVAKYIIDKFPELAFSHISAPPPEHVIYVIKHRFLDGKALRAYHVFIARVVEFISSTPYRTLLYRQA